MKFTLLSCIDFLFNNLVSQDMRGESKYYCILALDEYKVCTPINKVNFIYWCTYNIFFWLAILVTYSARCQDVLLSSIQAQRKMKTFGGAIGESFGEEYFAPIMKSPYHDNKMGGNSPL